MEENIRVSVRELVAFSYFPADITSAADASLLLKGTLAHQARQRQSEGESEKTIRHAFECGGVTVLVYGRMDVLVDGEIPLIEEIKLGGEPCGDALPEHWAQAVCYAAMLCLEKPCAQVRIRVCYTDADGMELQSFEKLGHAEEWLARMDALLAPYARFAEREQTHRRLRDESIRALSFPFPSYRPGQRELAVQVYTAIRRKRRLFASLPTGTGKSAAVLFPAIKAMGEGETERILYLTARNTARQSPLNALARMRQAGLRARCCVLSAKEKLCAETLQCDPEHCTRAAGHYVRQKEALEAILSGDSLFWDETAIRSWADRYHLCPFELALALTELADVVMMDLNYVFDPFAQVKRLYQRKSRCTLLADEAHHVLERVRDNLSGTLDSREIVRLRASYGKRFGRKNALYRAAGGLIHFLRGLEMAEGTRQLDAIPEGTEAAARDLLHAASEAAAHEEARALLRMTLPFVYALEHFDKDYAVLLEGFGRECALTLYCLLPGKEIAQTTKGMRGAVFFSATLSPLAAMKQLLGGTEEDACFALPSPFPREHLAVALESVNTRYEAREQSAQAVAEAIRRAVLLRPGSYIAYFPSYAYLEMVYAHLQTEGLPPLWVQTREMGEEDRAAFLAAFDRQDQPQLGLCVLGGLFSEGIDLPGDRLIGVMIVGVGLPVPSARVNAVRVCYERHFGDGFAYACRIPGMHKVLQAAGRVIRSETDTGLVLLLDERYSRPEYRALMPEEWNVYTGGLTEALRQLEALT